MTFSIKSRFIFDSPGRYFNKEGDIIDNWWSNYTSQGFNTRAQCMVDQYNKYPVDGGDQGLTHVSHVSIGSEDVEDSIRFPLKFMDVISAG